MKVSDLVGTLEVSGGTEVAGSDTFFMEISL
jgi:hypothetical protein